MANNKKPQAASAFGKNESLAHQQNELGIGLARQGRFEEARVHFEQAINLNSQYVDAYNNLGNIFQVQAKLDEAAANYEKAIKINPAFAMAQNNLGIVLRQLGRMKEAEICHRRALAIEPRYAEACFNLGNILCDQKLFEEAVIFYRQAIALNPNYFEAYLNLGNVFQAQAKYDEASQCYYQATVIKPNYAGAHHNLGNALLMLNNPEDAILSFRQALALKQDYAEASLSYGNALVRLRKYAEALNAYAHALTIRPEYSEVHTNRAMVNLCLGNFTEGWREYEWRWKLADTESMPTPHLPLWDGSDLSGKSILLYCEQGLGDSLQFIRYAPLIKARGGQVFLLCPQALARLFRNVDGIDQVFLQESNAPACNYRAPLMSLPMFFHTRIDTIPDAVPYLSPPSDSAILWRERLSSYAGLKVGLVWSGNARAYHDLARTIDARRSVNLEQFSSLVKIASDICFFSLQKGERSDQELALQRDLGIINLMNYVDDFADTAGFIANLDLVITVDTSVAHLAGGLGKPVWIMSRYDADWRWLQNRPSNPWYPTARIFGQPQAGDWVSVIESVSAALKEFQEKPV